MENNAVAGQPAHEVWNAWNAGAKREVALDEVSQRQSDLILSWLRDLGRTDLAILETGCGSGWMCARMTEFGAVTGIDLADEVIARAQERWPRINFIAGDFMAMDVPDASYDAVVSIETLSHIPDQAGYMAKVARVLKPGGVFLVATQNGPILRLNKIPPPQGWHRHWVDRRELRALIEPHMRVQKLTTVEPRAKEGPLRVLAAGRVRKLMNKLTGGLYQRALEHYGFGFSIVAYASKVVALE